MKIVHMIMAFETGGSETMLVDILNLQVEKFEVSLIIVNNLYSNKLLAKIDARVKIFLLNRKPSSLNVFNILRLNYWSLRLNADVIHFHNPAILSALLTGKKTVLTLHDVLTRSLKKDPNFMEKLEKFNYVCAISDCVKYDILSNGFSRPEDVIVVDNGISVDHIRNDKAHKKYEGFKIIQVSRLEHDKKGQHILLRAVSELVNNHGVENISVDFVGSGDSRKYLEKLAKDLQLEEHVNFLGLRDRDYIYSTLSDYDLFVQPSLFEGFGLTVAEAMAAKTPVLVSNIDGPMEIIDKGRYGYFFEVGNYRDCANQIIQIILN